MVWGREGGGVVRLAGKDWNPSLDLSAVDFKGVSGIPLFMVALYSISRGANTF